MSEKIEIQCPNCNVKIHAPVNLIGKKAKCPRCQNVIDVIEPNVPLAPIELESANQDPQPQTPQPQKHKPQILTRQPASKVSRFKKPFMKRASFSPKPSVKPTAYPYAKVAMPKGDSHYKGFSTQPTTDNSSIIKVIGIIVIVVGLAIIGYLLASKGQNQEQETVSNKFSNEISLQQNTSNAKSVYGQESQSHGGESQQAEQGTPKVIIVKKNWYKAPPYNSLYLECKVKNIGKRDASNVKITAKIFDSSGNVYLLNPDAQSAQYYIYTRGSTVIDYLASGSEESERFLVADDSPGFAHTIFEAWNALTAGQCSIDITCEEAK